MLMGRVPANFLLERSAWEFRTESERWDRDDAKAAPIFEYPIPQPAYIVRRA